MTENAVEDYAYAPLAGFFSQAHEVLVSAQSGFDVHVVGRIVAVVGRRLKHRVQIDAGDSERPQVIEFIFDALEAAAVHRPFSDVRIFAAHIVSGLCPVILDDTLRILASAVDPFDSLLTSFAPALVTGESVREYLVDDTVLVPLRYFGPFEYGYLKAVRVIVINTALSAQIVRIVSVIKDLPLILAFELYLERVPEQAALIRNGDLRSEPAGAVVFHFDELRISFLIAPKHQLDALRMFIFHIKRKRDFRPCFRSPEGLSVLFLS